MSGFFRRLVLLFAFIVSAQAADPGKPLTNEGVVVLAHAGYNERFLVELMKYKECKFDTSVEGLVYLAKQGISEKLVKAILAAEKAAILREELESEEPAKPTIFPITQYKMTRMKVLIPLARNR
jgi:hypothetical protein